MMQRLWIRDKKELCDLCNFFKMVLELRRAVVLKTSSIYRKEDFEYKTQKLKLKGPKNNNQLPKKNGEKHNIDMAANSVK